MTTTAENDGVSGLGTILHRLKSTAPPLFLSPSPELAESARSASQHLFSLVKPYASKSPFETLLIDGFDAEQIWQQIDLQTQPLLSSLRRDVKRFERGEEDIRGLFQVEGARGMLERDNVDIERENLQVERESESESEEEEDELEMSELERESEEEEEEERETEEDEERDGEGVEDKFLKIKELEEYMEDDEAREYGVKKMKKKKQNDEEEEEEDDDDDDEEDEVSCWIWYFFVPYVERCNFFILWNLPLQQFN